MTPLILSYPYTVLRLVGLYCVHLRFGLEYNIKVWEYPDGSYVARVGFRLRSPAGLIGFEAKGATIQSAFETVVDQVDQECRDVSLDDLYDLIEWSQPERF
jgi:hypothetical protein